MKEYMLLIRNEFDHQAHWSPDQHREFLEKCERYIGRLNDAGKLISAQPLVREGKMVSGTHGAWNEGLFRDSAEVIVGYYHVRADDMNDAVAIAKENPEFEFGTTARVEVRPIKMKEEETGFVYPEKEARTKS